MEYIFLFSGLILGSLIAWFVAQSVINKRKEAEKEQLKKDLQEEKDSMALKEKESAVLEEKSRLSEEESTILRVKLDEKDKALSRTQIELADRKNEIKNLLLRLEEERKRMLEYQEQARKDFENLAQTILKKNSAEFVNMNKERLDEIINPLKERIKEFEKKVQDTHEKEVSTHGELRNQLKNLQELNQRISEEANNLTNALKTDVKQQGNWGEMVLERILERSGLRKGHEYRTQLSEVSDDGSRLQPDFVVDLPENKYIIIDSKVSLVSYNEYVNAKTEEEKESARKAFLLSLKTHIKGLGEKNYQNLPNLPQPDFVLMFIPIESSFSFAIHEDRDLFESAWRKHIVLVSPSTLFATLKTIESIWKQEYQNRNVLEIADQSGKLLDKFYGFLKDMSTLGSNLKTAQKTYDSALNKLSEGKGNLVSRSEKIRELGARASKELPTEFNTPNEE